MKYIRLETDSAISEDDIELVFDVISEHTDIELTTALDDDGEVISDQVAVCVYESEDAVTYEIRVADDTPDEVVEQVARELNEELAASVDFRLEIAED